MVAELAVCVVGIYVFFITWQLTQERIGTHSYNGTRFRYFIFLSLVQSLCASLVGAVYHRLVRRAHFSWPSRGLWAKYLQCAILSAAAPQFGYAALKHVDYPTVILAKSCKLVPVLLMNFLIYRRTFPASKYAVVALITAGVSAFMLLHKQEDGEGGHKGDSGKDAAAGGSLYGLGLLLINLLMDGAVNSTQDRVFHKYAVSGSSMMVFLNLVASALMAGYLVLWPGSGGELSHALAFCSAHPQVIVDVLLFGLCGAIGQCFIYYTLERFGAVSLVTVTVTRKMFSILLSFFWFEHSVSLGQWGAVALVFAGIGLEAFMKRGGGAKKEEKEVRDKPDAPPLVEAQGSRKDGAAARRRK